MSWGLIPPKNPYTIEPTESGWVVYFRSPYTGKLHPVWHRGVYVWESEALAEKARDEVHARAQRAGAIPWTM